MLCSKILALGLTMASMGASGPIKRAGGPIATPIPDKCTVTSPLPQPSCAEEQNDGYKLNNNFTSGHLIYQAYYDSPLTPKDTWTQCEEQCYGYGTPGTCKTALLAYNVPTPPGWLNTSGGDLQVTACLFYDAYATSDDFELAPAGQYVNETAGNIYCSV